MVSTASVLHGIAVVHMCVEHIPEVEPEPASYVGAGQLRMGGVEVSACSQQKVTRTPEGKGESLLA